MALGSLSDEEIWRLYILLTRMEAAFRTMKSPLMERPIFYHLEHRVQTHTFFFPPPKCVCPDGVPLAREFPTPVVRHENRELQRHH